MPTGLFVSAQKVGVEGPAVVPLLSLGGAPRRSGLFGVLLGVPKSLLDSSCLLPIMGEDSL
jgi:hypothetical protein